MSADDMRSEGTQVLTLPGWQGSGPGHWQTLWERDLGAVRVEQHDWMRPLRGDWCARLDEVLVDRDGPVLLAAHSLGCLLVAAWAAHSRQISRVRGALLVAPPDLGPEPLRAQLPGWWPVPRERLPFPATLVASRDDPYGSFAHAEGLARDWGCALRDAGPRGHINAESGLGDWPEGRRWLRALDRNEN